MAAPYQKLLDDICDVFKLPNNVRAVTVRAEVGKVPLLTVEYVVKEPCEVKSVFEQFAIVEQPKDRC